MKVEKIETTLTFREEEFEDVKTAIYLAMKVLDDEKSNFFDKKMSDRLEKIHQML